MKRILYTLLGMMLSVGAWAQTLQEQINSATEATTIQLSENVNLGAITLVIPEGKNITLDLNGHNITSSASGAVAVKNNGTLTVKDTSAEPAGKIVSTKYAGIGAGNNSTTTFESGNIESVEGAIITGKVVGATITINGGTLSASDNAVIMGNGSSRDGNANTITINDGTFNGQITSTGYVACGIYAPWKDVITVNGGTFNITGGCGVLARAGSVTINGGVFNCTGNVTGKVGDSRVVVPCSAIVYDSEAKYPAMTAESKIEVPSTSTASFTSEVDAVSVVGESHISISGGSYSSPLKEDVCADGFIPTKNDDGTYGVKEGQFVAKIGDTGYETLAEAVTAATDGQTISLLDNTTENIIVPAGKNITLDLNGKTLSGGSVASNGKNAAIVNNGTLVIQDSSAEQTGTIKREDDDTSLSASSSYYVIDNQGTMTIKSGTVINKAGVPGAHKGSSLIRNGEPNTAVLNIEGGTLTQDNFDVIKNGGNGTLNISGGTINSANSYAVLSYSEVNMTGGVVNGKFCLRSYTDSEEDTHGVGNITGGTINGDITVETYTGNTPNTLSECNISDDAVINGTLSVGEGNGKTFEANDENGTIAVSGGTFKYDVPEQYCANGFIPTKNDDGTYGVKEGSFVAQIGENKYESLADAVAAATEGQTVTLLADINEAVTNANTNSFTIDLNGKNWISSGDAFKNNGGTVTFTGEGLVKSTATDGIAVWARTGSIIIDGGNYENCSNEEATVYVGTKNDLLGGNQPSVTINGGSFKNTADGVYKWNTNLLPLTLNVHNDISNADAYQAIVINGGTFYGNDPSIGDDSQLNKINKNSNFVAPDLHAEMKDGVFVIKEGGYVAQVGYLKYITLDEAATIAVDKTITLLADATIETIDVVAEKTIDKNGHEITVNTFEVIDFATFNIPFDFTAKTATYTRNVAGNEWGTVCVPFTLKSTEAIKLYEFGNITGDVLTVNEVETAAPGTPVVFANTAKSTSVTFTTEDASVNATATSTTGTLIGTYTEQKINSGLESIYFINGDKFHQAKASLTVPAYRAYIKNTSAGAKAAVLNIVVDGDATAIESVATDLNTATAIYDVNGRKLSAPQKGINIMKLANGKSVKLIVK